MPTTPTQVDWAAGASILIRAETLRDVGLFDETFFLYFEETDLILRAARTGWTCWFVPDARVVHVGSVSTGMREWARMPDYWFASRRHYFVKNHGRVYAALAWCARISGATIHAVRCRVTGQPSQDAPHFLPDLFRFGLGLGPAGRRQITPAPLRRIPYDRRFQTCARFSHLDRRREPDDSLWGHDDSGRPCDCGRGDPRRGGARLGRRSKAARLCSTW
ncbi:glycosyltransferase family 2 protein [Sulfitobacter aestuariivivens]|uniref:glycosyltransferase family 2 protein n=1 Tax=Sulfitobacter aestuariivivens TaxID=2766981 RepID=UPI0036200726